METKIYLADIGCVKALIDERRFSKDEMERADRALKQSRVALKHLRPQRPRMLTKC